MNPADTQLLAFVSSLADMCRSKGVKHVKLDGCEMELGPLDAAPMKDSPRVDAETCACGHGLHAHNAGLCLHGCAVEKCASEVTA